VRSNHELERSEMQRGPRLAAARVLMAGRSAGR
jgi:hypothetical protein